MTNVTFPTTVDEVTPAWLTSVLRNSGALSDHSAVVAVKPELIAEGVGFMAYLYRLHLTLDGSGPSTLVVKLPTDTDYLEVARMFRAYAREVAFYSQVGPSCPLRIPKVHVAEISSEGMDFIILMEDLGHLEAGDHIVGIPFERAERVIDELVRFHSWAWNLTVAPARHPMFEAIDSPSTTGPFMMGIALGWAAYRPHARVDIPTGLAEVIENWAERFPAMVATLTEPATLLNGDLRIDNLFFDPPGNPTTVDFQLVMRGAGIWDVAYLVGQGMTPEQRGGRERNLVQRYVDGLQEVGIDYSFDQAWRQFRTAVVAQVTMPLSAGMSWDTLSDRAKELLHALNERAFAIITDTGALKDLPF